MKLMNRAPKKAFILAAGFGKRLYPLTQVMPKPLLPLWNIPLIDHVISMLKSWGVEDIVVNAHWQADKIADHIESGDYGVKIQISAEKEILGTGGALLPWRDFFSDDPFWVVNGDIAAALECQPLIDAFCARPRSLGACWVTDKKGPRTVEIDRLGRITCYRSLEPGIKGTYTFCGLQLVSPEIFDYIPARTFSTLVDAYQAAMFKDRFMKGVNIASSYWNDAGTPDRYRMIHMETKRLAAASKAGGALYDAQSDLLKDKHSGFLCISRGSEIGIDVKGHASIIFDGVSIERGSTIRDSVIQGGRLSGKLNKLLCISGDHLDDAELVRAVKSLGWDLSASAFEFLGSRGSDRSFWRGLNGNRRFIFIKDGGTRRENQRYAGHTGVLQKAGIPVPELLYSSSDQRSLVLEDFGNDSLQSRMERDPERAEKLYKAVIEKVVAFHRNVTKIVADNSVELEPPFDEALYQWEHDLFEEHMIKERYGLESLPDAVKSELKQVASDLEKGTQVVIHRDLQSSNILFKGRNFAFIDFQGMRFGSPAYDIASLLYDPYVNIEPKLRCALVAFYTSAMPESSDVLGLFFKGAVQRLVQSLGAFGRLSGVGHSSFEKYIIPALENLLEAADASDLDALGALVEELISREQMRRGYASCL